MKNEDKPIFSDATVRSSGATGRRVAVILIAVLLGVSVLIGLNFIGGEKTQGGGSQESPISSSAELTPSSATSKAPAKSTFDSVDKEKSDVRSTTPVVPADPVDSARNTSSLDSAPLPISTPAHAPVSEPAVPPAQSSVPEPDPAVSDSPVEQDPAEQGLRDFGNLINRLG